MIWGDPLASRYEEPDPSDGTPTWTDYAKTFFKVGTPEIAASAPAAARWMLEGDDGGPVTDMAVGIAKYLQTSLGDFSESSFEDLTPAMQERLSAAITTEEFWAHPLSSMAAQATRMAPSVIAAVIPATAVSGAMAASIVAGTVAGGLSAGSTIDEIYRVTDAMSDDELRAEVPYYAMLRDMEGLDEKEAREAYNEKIIGLKPAILFALGTATGAVGVPGQIIRATKGAGNAAGRGLAGRVAHGAAVGGSTEFVQTAAEDYATQRAMIEGELQDEIDHRRLVDAALTGGALGGVFGAGAGVPSGRRASTPPPPPPPQPSPTSTTVPGGPVPPPPGATATPPPAQPGATPAPPPPPPGATPGTQTGGVEVVEPGAPDAAATQALAEAAAPVAPPVAEPPPAPVAAPQPAAVAPQSPVTPEGNTPVAPPAPAPPRQPRILVDKAAEKAIQKDTDAKLAQNLKSMKAGTEEPKSNKSRAEVEAKEKSNTVAKSLFDSTQLDFDTDYTTAEGRQILRNTLGSIVLSATDAGIEWKQNKDRSKPFIPAKVKKGGASDHEVWLRETYELAKRLGSKGFTGPKAVERIRQYIANFKAAQETGDFAPMRGDRALEGDLAKAQAASGGGTAGDLADTSGNAPTEEVAAAREAAEDAEGEGESFDPGVSDVTALSGTADDKDAVQTTIPKSKRGVAKVSAQTTVNEEVLLKGGGKAAMEVAEAAGDARKIEVTPELNAKYVASLEAAARKNRDAVPTPKAKVEVIKKKAAAKAPPKVGPKAEAAKSRQPSRVEDMTFEEFEAATKKGIIGPAEASVQNILGYKFDRISRPQVEPRKGVLKFIDHGMNYGYRLEDIARFLVHDVEFDQGIINEDFWTQSPQPAPTDAAIKQAFANLQEDLKKYGRRTTDAAKTGKAKVDAEAKKVNPDPTPAQVAAGNYEKGHLRQILPGYEISLETAKGGTRRNKDPKGPAWEVVMPAHYGHILGTKGADGDPVDVFLGPRAYPGNAELDTLPVIVVDQHIATPDGPGKFDEHKVFVGFDDVKHALDIYTKSFSDGRGFDRFGDVKAFEPDEFKAWLKERQVDKPTAEETALGREAIFESERTEETGFGPAILPSRGAPPSANYVPGLKPKLSPYAEYKARADLNRVTVTDVSGVYPHLLERVKESHIKITRVMGPMLLARMRGLAKDVTIKIMPDDLYPKVTSLASYWPRSHEILIRQSAWRGPHGAELLMHEIAHAAFIRATSKSPEIQNAVSRIATEAAERLRDTAHRKIYAFSNIDEFIAEAFSNSHFQSFLANTPASTELALGLQANRANTIGRPIRTLWDAILHIVAKAFRLPTRGEMTLLDGMLQVGAELEFTIRQSPQEYGGKSTRAEWSAAEQDLNRIAGEVFTVDGDPVWESFDTYEAKQRGEVPYRGSIADTVNGLMNRADLQEQKGAPRLMKLRTFDSIARTADRYFPGNNPVRKIADIVEATAVTAKRLFNADGRIIAKFAALERKYKGSGEWDRFSALVHDETETGIYADQPIDSVANAALTGVDTLHGPWLRQQHPELHRRWQALPDDLKAARAEAIQFYTDRQNAMAFGILKNRILKMLGINDDAMARRIFEGTQTAADETALGDARDAILEAKELSKIKGPYLPLMRRGEWVVRATVPITSPGNAAQLEPNVWEFSGPSARDDALAWGNTHGDIRPTITSVWVDATTGSKYVTDPQTGREIRITKNDANAENRFRVELQNKHVEFYDTQKEALAAAKEMEDAGLNVMGTVARRADGGANADLLSHQIRELTAALGRRKSFKDMTPTMQHEMTQALNELSLRMLGSTRIQTKRLPRTNVRGASRDLTRNMMEYSHSAAGHLAKLEHMPQLDKAMKEMRELADGDYSKETALGRSTIAKEIEARVNENNGHQSGKTYSPFVSRILAASFIDKLASVSYSMINATQPTLLTMPVLAARYGLARSATALTKAYADVGAGSMIARGAKDTARMARTPLAETTNFLDDLKARVSAREAAMFQYLADVGAIDPEGGLEIEKIVPSLKKGTLAGRVGTGVDATIGYLEGIARQMPKAIEAVNRSVTALAAYRLEMRRSNDHDKAVRAAQDAVNETQFNYSATNAPPIFNHPLARIAFQFKKFGLGVYQIIGHQIGKAIVNANPGDRAEALRALAYIAAMHTAAAGALGLPTEPFKALVLGANAAGLTDYTWGDVEAEAREFAASMFGRTAGEFVSRGLPRAMGIDVSGRLGLDNLMIFGEPRTDDTRDVWGWFTEMAAGAPGGLMRDWHKGVGKLMDGDFVEAAESLVPVKTIADSIKAYRVASEGKKNATTGIQTMSPYGAGEVISRVIGFTPRREAEVQERASNFYAKSGREREQRQAMMADWANATPSERLRMWGRIELWNRGRSRDEKLTRSELNEYVRTRKTEQRTGTVRDGIRTNKRNRRYLEDTEGIYNTQ